MSYILPWRRKKETLEDVISFLRNNPGYKWKNFIEQKNVAITYLEIGVFKGENIIDLSKTYCKHPGSIMHCVDPWIDYEEYSEYKGDIESVYNTFIENMTKENLLEKIVIHKDFSENIIPSFEDDFFDIAFIDGNHETKYVYNDGIMTFPKVKSGGWIIFDDYDWIETKIGIDTFIEEYKDQLSEIKKSISQVFCKKL